MNLPTKSGATVEFKGYIIRIDEEGYGLKFLRD